MSASIVLAVNVLDARSVLQSFGALGVFVVVLAETGILLGQGVARTRAFLQKYGPVKAVLLARFIPVVRTVINPVAGVTGMDARAFTRAQVAGGLVWSLGLTLAGYALGSRIPNVDRYLLPIVAVVVLLSLLPIGLEMVRARRRAVRR